MIILKTRTEDEKTRTNFGSLIVSIALLSLLFPPFFYIALLLIFTGIIIISIQDKTKIDLTKKVAVRYYNVIGIPFPLFRKETDLSKFTNAYLYQKSEKGAIQTRVQTLAYSNTEYWIKLRADNGREFEVGYIRNYKIAKEHLKTFH